MKILEVIYSIISSPTLCGAQSRERYFKLLITQLMVMNAQQLTSWGTSWKFDETLSNLNAKSHLNMIAQLFLLHFDDKQIPWNRSCLFFSWSTKVNLLWKICIKSMSWWIFFLNQSFLFITSLHAQINIKLRLGITLGKYYVSCYDSFLFSPRKENWKACSFPSALEVCWNEFIKRICKFMAQEKKTSMRNGFHNLSPVSNSLTWNGSKNIQALPTNMKNPKRTIKFSD